MTLEEKLKNIKKTSTLKALNCYPNIETALDLDELWVKVIEPNLPKKSVVEKWHKILMEYVKQDDAVLSLRAYGNPSGNSPALRRGFLNKVYVNNKETFETFYVDNFFTSFFYSMARDGYAPANLEEFKQLMDNRSFPCGCIQTNDERELAAYFIGINPKISEKGYKIAHIFSAGENFNSDAGYDKISDFCKAVFPRGNRSEWCYKTDKGHNYRRVDCHDMAENEKIKKFAVAHFLRIVHPINYFLVPNKPGSVDKTTNILKTNIYWQENGKEYDEIGEYPKLVEYVAAKFRSLYGMIYDEFLSMIYPSKNAVNPIGDNVVINAEYAIGIWHKKVGSIPTSPIKAKTRKNRKNRSMIIELIPNDVELFKKLLLTKKKANFTLIYDDGKIINHNWNANNFSESSNLLNNIKSRLNHRDDRNNIVKAVFEVVK